MTGRGRAHGAVTILNATATGIGCALAVHAPTTATWTPQPGGLVLESGGDDRLAQAVAAGEGARVSVRCPFPPARGLKTSSSVAAALVRAAADARGERPDADAVARAAVDASRRAGVTLTGAFDDQVAVCRGGAWLTDNAALRVLARLPVRPWHVALWVPDARIAKSEAARVDVAPLRAHAGRIAFLLRAGRLPEALTANGRMMHAAYARAGLPVTDEPVRVALASGALGAGLSGTGPAVAALFDAPCDVPAVAGGSWRWTRVVEAA